MPMVYSDVPKLYISSIAVLSLTVNHFFLFRSFLLSSCIGPDVFDSLSCFPFFPLPFSGNRFVLIYIISIPSARRAKYL